jgi:hypothetical protein
MRLCVTKTVSPPPASLYSSHIVQKERKEWINVEEEDEVDWMLQELSTIHQRSTAVPNAFNPTQPSLNPVKSHFPPLSELLMRLRVEVTLVRIHFHFLMRCCFHSLTFTHP